MKDRESGRNRKAIAIVPLLGVLIFTSTVLLVSQSAGPLQHDPPTLVSSSVNKATSSPPSITSITCTLPSGVTKGDLLIVTTVEEANSPASVSSVTDSIGDTYAPTTSQAFSWDSTVYDDVSLWYVVAGTSSSSDTVTVNYSGPVTAGIVACYDISGFAISGLVSYSATSYPTTSTTPSLVTPFTPAPADLVFATAGWSYHCQNSTVGPSFTRGEGGVVPASCITDVEISDEYNLSWVSGATTAPQTLSSYPDTWGEVVADFTPSVSTTTTTTSTTPSCGATITTSTILTKNIGSTKSPCTGNGLIIDTSGITLNCKGHTIFGSGTGIGIWMRPPLGLIVGLTGVTVENCGVWHFGTGFELSSGLLLGGTSGNTLFHNTAKADVVVGFLLTDSTSNTLLKNTAVSNTGDGFELFAGSNGNSLLSNTAQSNGGVGFSIAASTGNSFVLNTARSNKGLGYMDTTVGASGYLTYGTGNSYLWDDAYGGNVVGGSSPVCTPAFPLLCVPTQPGYW